MENISRFFFFKMCFFATLSYNEKTTSQDELQYRRALTLPAVGRSGLSKDRYGLSEKIMPEPWQGFPDHGIIAAGLRQAMKNVGSEEPVSWPGSRPGPLRHKSPLLICPKIVLSPQSMGHHTKRNKLMLTTVKRLGIYSHV